MHPKNEGTTLFSIVASIVLIFFIMILWIMTHGNNFFVSAATKVQGKYKITLIYRNTQVIKLRDCYHTPGTIIPQKNNIYLKNRTDIVTGIDIEKLWRDTCKMQRHPRYLQAHPRRSTAWDRAGVWDLSMALLAKK